MLNAVSKQIYGSILNFDDATMIWTDLYNRFHMTNLPRTFHLIQQVQDLRQGSMDLSSYYIALKTLWDQIDGSEPAESCLCCRTSNCPSKRRYQEHVNRGRLIKFLAGLNESYSIIRGQIIMKKPLPDISEVYNILDQDDSQRKFGVSVVLAAFQVGNVGHHPGVVATVASNTAGSVNAAYQSQRKDKPICSNCGFTGHVIDRCYKLHGYPPGWKPRKQLATSPPSQSSTPIVTAQVSAPVGSSEKQSPGFESLIGNLSKEQLQHFIAYFSSHLVPQSSSPAPQTPQTNSSNEASCSGISFSNSTFSFIGILTVAQCVTNKRSWIIDSGATHHVSHDCSLFHDLDISVNQHVNLPNGHFVMVAGFGTVVINGSISLRNVLYIPEFRLNLLSISSLTADLGSRVVFDPDSCLIQDPIRGLTIGRGKRIANLYLLDVEDPADSSQLSFCSLNSVIDSAVWHKRLGHTSFSRIDMLTDVLGLSKQRNKGVIHCDIRRRAK